jgi:hypothetical protein
LNIPARCATKRLIMEKPFKELRFTRSRQALTFVIAGVLFLGATAGLLLLWWQRLDSPPSIWWALLPMTAAWGCFRLAAHLTRHAFLLLSPIGIEIFPFFRPSQNMQLFSWGEVQHAEVSSDERFLTLTLAGYEDAKVIISLAPVKPAARPLLAKAVAGVMEKRAEAPAPPSPH